VCDQALTLFPWAEPQELVGRWRRATFDALTATPGLNLDYQVSNMTSQLFGHLIFVFEATDLREVLTNALAEHHSVLVRLVKSCFTFLRAVRSQYIDFDYSLCFPPDGIVFDRKTMEHESMFDQDRGLGSLPIQNLRVATTLWPGLLSRRSIRTASGTIRPEYSVVIKSAVVLEMPQEAEAVATETAVGSDSDN